MNVTDLKIGDIYYEPCPFDGEIYRHKIDEYTPDGRISAYYIEGGYYHNFDVSCIGLMLFSTYKEAESKLKEWRANDETN